MNSVNWIFANSGQTGVWLTGDVGFSAINPVQCSVSVLMTILLVLDARSSIPAVPKTARIEVRTGICFRISYSNYTKCDTVRSNLFGHTIISSHPLRNMTALSYVGSILAPAVLPILSSHPGAIYQQDIARLHTALFSQRCLQGYGMLL